MEIMSSSSAPLRVTLLSDPDCTHGQRFEGGLLKLYSHEEVIFKKALKSLRQTIGQDFQIFNQSTSAANLPCNSDTFLALTLVAKKLRCETFNNDLHFIELHLEELTMSLKTP